MSGRLEANDVWVEILDDGNFVAGLSVEGPESLEPALSQTHIDDEDWMIVYDPRTNRGIALLVDASDPSKPVLAGQWGPIDRDPE